MLLTESCLDEMVASDEVPEGSHAIAELLDLTQRNFHSHVTLPAVRKTHSTPGICQKISAPVQPASAGTGSKGFDNDVTFVENNVVMVVVCIRSAEVLVVGIL